MNRVSTEVTKEVFMLFEDSDSYISARQQVPKHHTGRTATDDAASSLKSRGHSISCTVARFSTPVAQRFERLFREPAPPVTAVNLVGGKMQRLVRLVNPDVGVLGAMVYRDLDDDPAAS